MNNRNSTVYFFSFLLAFCSLFYEFVFAQILSVCLGGTKNQYLITISIFTFSLGMGTILFNFIKKNHDVQKIFFFTEVLLSMMGMIGPFILTWLLKPNSLTFVPFISNSFLGYLIIFFIGLLSGMELPCLFKILPNHFGKILTFDYAGMLIASVTFPLFFLPYFGTASSTMIVSNLNLLAVIWLFPVKINPKLSTFIILTIASFVLFNATTSNYFNGLLSRIYLGEF